MENQNDTSKIIDAELKKIEDKKQKYQNEIAAQNVRGFIMKWMIDNGTEFALRRGYRRKNTNDFLDRERILSMIYDTYHTQLVLITAAAKKATKSVPPRLEKERFKDALICMEQESIDQALVRLREELAFRPGLDGLEELRKWVKNLTGRDDELDVAAFYHFIWQTKRKLFRKKVDWHFMVVLYSNEQGQAKSVNARRISLIADMPVGRESDLFVPFTCKLNGNSMTDERWFKSFSDNYICFNDEFSKMDKQNYEEAKRLITEDSIQYRPMRTNEPISVPQNCTFIGTGNVPLNELIFDQSGIRRFYQVNVATSHTPESGKEQRRVAEQTDYLKIWQSVDENLSYENSWHSKFQENFTEVAESNRAKGEIERFMEAYNVRPGTLKVGVTDMFKAFQNFLSEENCKWELNRNQFKLKLQNKGIVQKHFMNGDFWLVDPAFNKVSNGIVSLDPVMDKLERRLQAARDAEDYMKCAEIKKEIDAIKSKDPLYGF